MIDESRLEPERVTADFVALGLGGTNMMAMLWSIAEGRTCIGVEMRGDPFLGVHWNIRHHFYDQLHTIDDMMLERYGPDRLPRTRDGRLFRMSELFYSEHTKAGDIVADEIIDGYDREQHIAGRVLNVEFIDDRWRHGAPARTVTVVDPPTPSAPCRAEHAVSVAEVLDGPSVFQAGAQSVLLLLRRYLEELERIDLALEPAQRRVRLLTRHRVARPDGGGFVREAGGVKSILVEPIIEHDHNGRFVRIRNPVLPLIRIDAPELFVIAQGFSSTDAAALGFTQRDVVAGRAEGLPDGEQVVHQADYVAGLMEILVDGRLRRRIASEFDDEGNEYWVRQIAVGHENDPEVGWILVQVPDFLTFCPIERGVLPGDVSPDSPEYATAYRTLLYEFYLREVSKVLEIPAEELRDVQMVYGPKLFSLVERIGDDALVAANGVVAGDSFGNGHFLTSGGAMTGMVGHAFRVRDYWRDRRDGVPPAEAIRTLADAIRVDTLDWLAVSEQEFTQPFPINFGAERIRQISTLTGDGVRRSNAISASRRSRHALIPLDSSDWRRLVIRHGKVVSAPLPPLSESCPGGR